MTRHLLSHLASNRYKAIILLPVPFGFLLSLRLRRTNNIPHRILGGDLPICEQWPCIMETSKTVLCFHSFSGAKNITILILLCIIRKWLEKFEAVILIFIFLFKWGDFCDNLVRLFLLNILFSSYFSPFFFSTRDHPSPCKVFHYLMSSPVPENKESLTGRKEMINFSCVTFHFNFDIYLIIISKHLTNLLKYK